MFASTTLGPAAGEAATRRHFGSRVQLIALKAASLAPLARQHVGMVPDCMHRVHLGLEKLKTHTEPKAQLTKEMCVELLAKLL